VEVLAPAAMRRRVADAARAAAALYDDASSTVD
jgi:hypothetical protein